MALTKRQKEVLDYLVAFETKHGYAPSFEEIGKGLKLTSLATVHKHITTLEKKGFIRAALIVAAANETLFLQRRDVFVHRCERRQLQSLAYFFKARRVSMLGLKRN